MTWILVNNMSKNTDNNIDKKYNDQRYWNKLNQGDFDKTFYD